MAEGRTWKLALLTMVATVVFSTSTIFCVLLHAATLPPVVIWPMAP